MSWWSFHPALFLTLSVVFLSMLVVHTDPLFVELFLGFSSPSTLMFCVDWVSITFISMTLFVSSMVFLFALWYMNEDPWKNGFIWTLFLFSFSMVFLSISGGLFSTIVGWDLLGISSFCLIIFYQNWQSFNSGMITFVTNRLGDGALIIALCVSLISSGELLWVGGESSALIVLGALTKSAQLPFSSWLPRAMAAPTPVSALVHSSTLVTAGVFILVRYMPCISDSTLKVVSIISFATIILAGFSSLGEVDLKKIVALSTLSHISLIMYTISIGFVEVGVIHMVIHAVFKSSLFIVSGIIIHYSSEQDLRFLSVCSSHPSVQITALFSIMSMAGAPFLAGFLSKELILSVMELKLSSALCFFIGSALTSSYSVRLVINLFMKNSPCVLTQLSSQLSCLLISLSIFSSFMCGMITTFVTEGENLFISISSLESKVGVFVSMMVGILMGVIFSFYSSKGTLGSMVSSMWFISSIGESLVESTRACSWMALNLVDVKGHLDLPLSKSKIAKMINHLWSMSVPGPISILKVLTLFILSMLALLWEGSLWE